MIKRMFILAPQQIRPYTYLGYGSLFIWSFGAVFTAHLNSIPTFEILSVVFTVSFLVMATKLSLCKQWHYIKQTWQIWLIGFIGIYGNDFLFVAAFKYAPPIQVDLINYLWPILVILFSALLPNESLKWKYLVAAGLGFYGVYLLIMHNGPTSSINANYSLGYCLAFAEACVWCIYTLLCRFYNNIPTEMVGMYCGIGALFSIPTHFILEPTIIPSHSQIGILLLMGLTTQGLAYLLWDIGVKRGNYKILTILSYGNPILSVILLLLCGLATLNIWVVLSCLLVSGGCLVANMNWNRRPNFLTKLF